MTSLEDFCINTLLLLAQGDYIKMDFIEDNIKMDIK
jgi:hypothetical protein